MKNVLLVLAVLILGAGAYYYFVMLPKQEAASKPTPVLIPPKEDAKAVPESPAEPSTELTDTTDSSLEPVQPEEPLPSLAESDPTVVGALSAMIGESAVTQYVIPENLIGRIVVTVDSMTARQLPGQLLPIQPPGTRYEANVDVAPPEEITNNQGDVLQQYLADPVNTGRYSAYVELLETIDAAAMVAQYRRYYPLFEEAYIAQGYPEGGFHARLLEVIDHLLAASSATEPVRLIKPEAYYLFTDPALESLTAGQKLMIRMGSGNAERVKEKLRELRAALGETPPA